MKTPAHQPIPLWKPRDIETTEIGRYIAWLHDHGHIDTPMPAYHELWEWSVEDPDRFWGSLWQFFGGEDAGNLGRGTRMRDDHIALAVQLDLAAGADNAQTAEVAMVAAAVCAGGTAAHGLMALRLFDESLSATPTEPQR